VLTKAQADTVLQLLDDALSEVSRTSAAPAER
jgi:hypothetical protein